MSFSWWFSKKIALGKNTKNNLSSIIIRVGQIAVALGLIVSLVTISTGVGARKAIKEKLADFNGHITIRNYNSNTSLNSDSLSLHQAFYPKFKSIPENYENKIKELPDKVLDEIASNIFDMNSIEDLKKYV